MKKMFFAFAVAVMAIVSLSGCSKSDAPLIEYMFVPVVQVTSDVPMQEEELFEMLEEAAVRAGFRTDDYLHIWAEDDKDAVIKLYNAPQVNALEQELRAMPVSGRFLMYGATATALAEGSFDVMTIWMERQIGAVKNSSDPKITFAPAEIIVENADGMEMKISENGASFKAVNVPSDPARFTFSSLGLKAGNLYK